jgi:hypothetical protein
VSVLKTTIRQFVALQKAALQGVPVYEVNDPNAQEGWEEYQQVGRELLYEVRDKSAQANFMPFLSANAGRLQSMRSPRRRKLCQTWKNRKVLGDLGGNAVVHNMTKSRLTSHMLCTMK